MSSPHPAPAEQGHVRSAAQEKESAAFWSVVAAVLLTGMKLFVGLATNSLGILAEAAHSALDFLAAAVTYVAVRVSDRPADQDHPYGHKKIENLSALFETVLLLLTCGWIVWESIHRLLSRDAKVDTTVWSFVVVVVSIAIDWGRSRNLMKMAKKHGSQALEADALHFSTDIWSSCVVLVGLACLKLNEFLHLPALELADSVAALGVSAIVVWVSITLGRKTIDALLDKAPDGLRATIEAEARAVSGVEEVIRVRLREAGDTVFVDLTVAVGRNVDLESSHRVADGVEERIRKLAPKSDVVVHVEPLTSERETVTERLRVLAAQGGLAVHNVSIIEVGGRRRVDLHLEVDEKLNLNEAHALADRLEAAIKAEFKDLAEVTTHIEARRMEVADAAGGADDAAVFAAVRRAVAGVAEVRDCHDITVLRTGGALHLTLHCLFKGTLPIAEIHRLSSAVERRIAATVPGVGRVLVHAEPEEQG